MSKFNLYKLEAPAKWRAGYSGAALAEIYFSCGDCGKRDCDMGGYMATEPAFTAIAVLENNGVASLAIFCVECFDKRWQENERRLASFVLATGGQP